MGRKKLGVAWFAIGVVLAVIAILCPTNTALAASNSAASSTLSAIKSESSFSAGYSYGEAGCWRFVDAVCRRIYGEGAPGGTSGYQLTNPGNYPCVGQVTAPSYDAVKNLLLRGYPGDIVQLKGGSAYCSWQHTFVLESVDDSGITIFEHLDSTGVRTAWYSWGDFYSSYGAFSTGNSSHGVSLYHYNRYEEVFPSNANPAGHLDSVSGGYGTITVRGWAYDPDAPSQSIDVHAYIGGPVGTGEAEGYAITADKLRTDVNNAYGISGNHGFEATITTGKRGLQPVYFYAIDSAGGYNPLVASGEASISEPVAQGEEMSYGYPRVLPDGDYLIVLTSTLDSSPYYYLDISGTNYPAAELDNVGIYGTNIPAFQQADFEKWTLFAAASYDCPTTAS